MPIDHSCAPVRKNLQPLPVLLGLIAILSLFFGEIRAESSEHAHRTPASCTTLLIQGRIVAFEGSIVTVKTPDTYPGSGPGIHAQFVKLGSSFRLDISAAHILLPDGAQPDRQPLAVGNHVVAVLCGRPSNTVRPNPSTFHITYHATIIERTEAGEKVITH